MATITQEGPARRGAARPLAQRPETPFERGAVLATVLAGSWRSETTTPCLSPAVVDGLVPLLIQAGAAGLGWRRLRRAELPDSLSVRQLQQSSRCLAIEAAVHSRMVCQAVDALRSAGMEPLLFKGWAIARSYPQPGLRPSGDIDLCVRPEEYRAASASIHHVHDAAGQVDIHVGFSRDHLGFSLLNDGTLDEIYERSEQVPLGDTEVRILGPEDHLRLLCLHMLGHGAWRALWLCDVAVALESRPPTFDWDRCLRGDRRRADWVVCTLGLAHQLLGARIEDTPAAERARNLPRWLAPVVLRQWGQGYRMPHWMAPDVRHPLRSLRGLHHHWRNPIQGTVEVGGPFNDWPRLPFQVAACARRTAQFVAELPAWRRAGTQQV